MNMDVGMHHAKNRGNKEPLSNTIKDTSTIMRNPSLHNSDKGLRMIVLVSLIVLLRGSLFPRFFAWCIPTSIFIQLNDFSTCIICIYVVFHSIYNMGIYMLLEGAKIKKHIYYTLYVS